MRMTRVTIPDILDMEPHQVNRLILIEKLYSIIKRGGINVLNISNHDWQHNNHHFDLLLVRKIVWLCKVNWYLQDTYVIYRPVLQ